MTDRIRSKGFVQVPREDYEGPYFTEKRRFSKWEALQDIRQSVRYSKETTSRIIGGKMIYWGENEFPASYSYLTTRWGRSKDWVQSLLKYLVDQKIISVAQVSGQTVITILKKDFHQEISEESSNESGKSNPLPQRISDLGQDVKQDADQENLQDAKQDADQEQTERRKKKKTIKINKERIIQYAFGDQVFVDTYNNWICYLKEKKKSPTELTIKYQNDFLKNFAPIEAIEIINKSIRNGWTGIFKPEKQSHETKPGTSAARLKCFADL